MFQGGVERMALTVFTLPAFSITGTLETCIYFAKHSPSTREGEEEYNRCFSPVVFLLSLPLV